MKKLRLLSLIAMLAVITVASAQVSFGVKGGINASNFYGENVNDNNVKIGFHAGLAADFHFTPEVALQTGLFASTKGFSYKASSLEYSSNLVYLQLPVHLAYKVEITPGTRVFFHAGPYAAYGIAGKHNVKVGSLGSASTDVFGDGLAQFKAFDAGAGFGVGFEFGQFLVDLGWDMGFVNISQTSVVKVKNQNGYLSVGFKF